MDNRGASAFKVVLIVAAVLVALIFGFMGQLYFAGFLVLVAIGLGIALLFSRAKTPTD
jgi:cadmium resistance protein CadD (predicted permease)